MKLLRKIVLDEQIIRSKAYICRHFGTVSGPFWWSRHPYAEIGADSFPMKGGRAKKVSKTGFASTPLEAVFGAFLDIMSNGFYCIFLRAILASCGRRQSPKACLKMSEREQKEPDREPKPIQCNV